MAFFVLNESFFFPTCLSSTGNERSRYDTSEGYFTEGLGRYGGINSKLMSSKWIFFLNQVIISDYIGALRRVKEVVGLF